jgi:hypothetical protein
MNAQNGSERKKAFTRFLLYYLLSLIVFILIIYAGVKVPSLENRVLKERVAVLEQEQKTAAEFLAGTNDIRHLLDSVNMAGVQAELIDAEITNALVRLKVSAQNDAAGEKQYLAIVNLLLGYQEAKKLLRNAGSKDATLSASQQQLEKLEADLKDCNKRKEDLMIQLSIRQ